MSRRTFSGAWPLVGATARLAVGRQASVLDRPAHHRRWAAYAMSLGLRGSGSRV